MFILIITRYVEKNIKKLSKNLNIFYKIIDWFSICNYPFFNHIDNLKINIPNSKDHIKID